MPTEAHPTSKLAETPISDDETVATMGHPDFVTGQPSFLDVVVEVVEDADEVVIGVGDSELAELPRFVLGLGDDLRLRCVPLCEEFVHLSFTVEVQPEEGRDCVAVVLAEGGIREKQSAISP
jgi:hypothetical protein